MMKNPDLIFQKFGGSYQLLIDDLKGLENVLKTDEALWAVTSAPVESFACDKAFLKYLDADHNGRLRPEEIKNAIKWLFKVLNNKDSLLDKSPSLNLDFINRDDLEGAALHSSALMILKNINAPDAGVICLEQIRDRQKFLFSGACNGDGIIPPDALPENPEVTVLLDDIRENYGSVKDFSGEDGINSEILEKFVSDAKEYVEWFEKSISNPDIMFYGKDTPEVFGTLKKLAPKIEQYFSLCHLLKLEPGSENYFCSSEKKFADLDINNPEKLNAFMLSEPLARPSVSAVLSLDGLLNPLYLDDIIKFKNIVMTRFRKDSAGILSFMDWMELKKLFAHYDEWYSSRKDKPVENLGYEKVRKYLSGNLIDKIRELIKADADTATDINNVENLEKLLLFKSNIMEFVNNFVSLKNLFVPCKSAIFQTGVLVMDERRFELTMRVGNHDEHKKTAEKSNICTIYLNITSKKGSGIETMEIAAAVTSGYMSNLYIGKAGVFYMPDGSEWDAKVIDFIKQPVSFSEAVVMPFRKVAELIGKQTERFVSPSPKDFETGLNKGLELAKTSLPKPAAVPAIVPAPAAVTPAPQAAPAPVAAAPAASPLISGIPMLVLGGGVGLAAVGSSFAFILNTIRGASFTMILCVILGIVLLITVPSLIVSYVKISRRNVAIFLEAAGWSVNARMKLSYSMGKIFTYSPRIPAEAELKKNDPSERNRKPLSKFQKFLIGFFFLLAVIFFVAVYAFSALDYLFIR